jgi:IS5 family transposase
MNISSKDFRVREGDKINPKKMGKKIEMRFAHMKRIFRLDRLRLRGLSGVRDEVLLTATAQNLRRLVKLLCRAPPPIAAACPA